MQTNARSGEDRFLLSGTYRKVFSESGDTSVWQSTLGISRGRRNRSAMGFRRSSTQFSFLSTLRQIWNMEYGVLRHQIGASLCEMETKLGN